jgi:dimethylargininase
MFTKAIVRTPCRNLIHGLTSAKLGKPVYDKALIQHKRYVTKLKACGLEIINLPANEDFPDSTFVEDVALLTSECAVITNPGAVSRRGETQLILPTIQKYFENIELIKSPGTVDAGDIMKVGSHSYIGLSERTNKKGAEQIIKILKKYGLSGSTVELKYLLHLKTGASYLENNNLLVSGELIDYPGFREFNLIKVDNYESYAANCIWINGKVLMPKGFSKTKANLESKGYETVEVNVSEFRKLDGGVSCLSLRF